jgi:hypothetical protein
VKTLITFVLLAIGCSAVAMAGPNVPEIDPGSGANALALIAGSLVVLRSWRKK